MRKRNEDLVITKENFSEKYEKIFYYVFNILKKGRIVSIPETVNRQNKLELLSFLEGHIQDIISYLWELLVAGDSRGKVHKEITSTFIFNQVRSYGTKNTHKFNQSKKYQVLSLDEKKSEGDSFIDLLPSDEDYYKEYKNSEEDLLRLKILKIICSKNSQALSLYNKIYNKNTLKWKKERERIEEGSLIEGTKKMKSYRESKDEKELKELVRQIIQYSPELSKNVKEYFSNI